MKTFSVLCILLILYTAKSLQAKNPEVCKNGGKPLGDNYPKCHCPGRYKGYDCNQKVTPCEGEPCRNFATCVEHEDGTFSCKCPHNYEGILCEKRVTPCDRHPCKNGGKCTDDGVKCFKCACPDGYKGSDCSKKVLPCEVSPCKNGAVCVNKKDGDFSCACKSGYRGLLCESKDGLFESLTLKDKPDYLKQLEDWVGKDNQWRVCYRASRDGWRAGDFHSRCDHKGPTVSIIRVGYYIFGGYADVSWGGTTGYKRSTTSFLFSLRNRDNLKPFKAPVYQNHGNAIYQNPSYGVTFGGGHDLHIKDNSHTSTGSYTNFGHTYRPPPGYKYSQQKTKDLLAGTYNGFKPDEIEVFYLR